MNEKMDFLTLYSHLKSCEGTSPTTRGGQTAEFRTSPLIAATTFADHESNSSQDEEVANDWLAQHVQLTS